MLDFVAVAIAPSSDVDRCYVNHRLLCPQSILPIDGRLHVEAVRGFRTGNVALAAANNDVDTEALRNGASTLPGRLDLLCYEPGDALVPPGPRAPAERTTRSAGVDVPETGYALAMRLLMHGRRRGTIWLRRGDGATATPPLGDTPAGPAPGVQLLYRLVKYLPRGTCEAIRSGGLLFTGDALAVEYEAIAYAPTVSEVSSSGAYRGATAQVIHFGGDDSFEEGDELEIWLGNRTGGGEAASPDTDWWVTATAGGEI